MPTIILLTLALIFLGLAFSYKRTILYRDILGMDGYKHSTPYLIRLTLFSCRLGSIKIHKALISDPKEPHDHPWNYISIILWGGYWEERTVYSNIQGHQFHEGPFKSTKWYKPGSILYRKGDQLHKLIIPEGKYSISLIFTFKKWRKWGYINNEGIWEKASIQD